MRTKPRELGFTLVEAVVVVAITAIVVSVASPGFQGFIEKQRLDSVATQLATDIQFGRSEAVLRNEGVRLKLQSGAWGTCYVLHTGSDDECSCSAANAAQCAGAAQQIKSVVLPSDQPIRVSANVSSILFDPLHGTSTPTGTLRVTSASGRSIHHVVNVMGRIRSCSPQAEAPAVPGYRACRDES